MGFDHEHSRAVAGAMAATERAWRALEEEFGLFSATEVARVLSRSERAVVSMEQVDVRRRSGQLLSTVRGGEDRYPGFQFDPEGRVRSVVRLLFMAALEDRWSQSGLILWMCSPCGRLHGLRPVDCLGSPDLVLRAAHESFSASW